jgi:hypothetical protein
MNKASQLLATLDVELFYVASIGWGEIKLQGNFSRELLIHCKESLGIESFETSSTYGWLKTKIILNEVEITVLLT